VEGLSDAPDLSARRDRIARRELTRDALPMADLTVNPQLMQWHLTRDQATDLLLNMERQERLYRPHTAVEPRI
jgi:hypothetical protein